MSAPTNCPNCGAPINGPKCEYCGTLHEGILVCNPVEIHPYPPSDAFREWIKSVKVATLNEKRAAFGLAPINKDESEAKTS